MLYIAGQIFDMQVLAGFAVLYLSNLRLSGQKQSVIVFITDYLLFLFLQTNTTASPSRDANRMGRSARRVKILCRRAKDLPLVW